MFSKGRRGKKRGGKGRRKHGLGNSLSHFHLFLAVFRSRPEADQASRGGGERRGRGESGSGARSNFSILYL